MLSMLAHRIDRTGQVSTTYTVNGASGTYKVAIPLLHYEHLAFLGVSVQGEAVPYQLEGTMESEGVVVYSVGVGEPGDGAQITVSGRSPRACLLRCFSGGVRGWMCAAGATRASRCPIQR